MPLPSLDISPSVLKWARKESGLTVEEVARSLRRNAEDIHQWESTGEKVPFTALEKLANCYRRQPAVFFLPEPPKPVNRPKDKRNFNPLEHVGFKSESMLAIRRTSRYLELARELEEHKERYSWVESFKNSSSDAEDLALQFKNFVTYHSSNRQKITGKDFSFWRQKMWDLMGIYVFQFPMPEEELDGFSYIEDDIPYGITINSNNEKKRKLFTLFHELGHILYRESGLCLVYSSHHNPNTGIESSCNKFAAAFLMPRDSMQSVGSYDDLIAQSNHLNVSGQAYLWRLKSLGLVNDKDLKIYLAQIQTNWEIQKQKAKAKDGELKISPIQRSRSQRGEQFFDLIVNAYNDNRITASDASDILQIRPTRL